MNIPISRVQFGPDEEELVLQVLRSGRLTQGPMVERLEREFSEVSGTSYVVAVNNGTTALVAALQALDLRPGDEVITSPFTFVATLNAILEAGCVARFADIGDDYCLDPRAVAAEVSDRTRVLMPVHLYGLGADLPAIGRIAERHDLAVVEDAAQAHGAMVQGIAVGSYGIGCFSLYATKNVTAGEGGLITTNNAALADRLRLLRNQGMTKRYEYEMAGHNYRMTEMQAALAIPQLRELAGRTQIRRENARRITEGLTGLPGIVVPHEPAGRKHVWHQFTVRVDPTAGMSRDTLAKELATAGVGTGIYYPRLVHDYDCYRSHPQVRIGDTPNAVKVTREVLSLPVHPWLTRAEIQQIIASVRAAIGA